MVWAWNVRHRHPRHRGVEVEKGFVGDDRRDLRAEAAGAQVLVHDQAAVGATDAVEYHFLVPRLERSKVDDVGLEALSRSFTARDHRAPGDDGDLVALAGLLRSAERKNI